jgi:hypothetical protein
VILNVDRSAPEHAVHSTGSVGGGGQRRGPVAADLKGDFDTDAPAVVRENNRGGKGLTPFPTRGFRMAGP